MLRKDIYTTLTFERGQVSNIFSPSTTVFRLIRINIEHYTAKHPNFYNWGVYF